MGGTKRRKTVRIAMAVRFGRVGVGKGEELSQRQSNVCGEGKLEVPDSEALRSGTGRGKEYTRFYVEVVSCDGGRERWLTFTPV